MKKQVLLNVNYTDNTKKFWQESQIKNKIFTLIDGDIHKTIAEAVKEIDGIKLSYNGQPQSNVYIDTKDGDTKRVGYIYRGKTEIFNDKTGKYDRATFDIWVTIKEVKDYLIKSLGL